MIVLTDLRRLRMDKRPRNFPKSGATLTPERVRAIRRGVEKGIPAVYFAKLYEISAEAVRKAARYESWGWVSDDEGISMTPSENVRDWPQQVEDKILASVPEPSQDEIAKNYAKVQELLKKPPLDPFEGWTEEAIARYKDYKGIK